MCPCGTVPILNSLNLILSTFSLLQANLCWLKWLSPIFKLTVGAAAAYLDRPQNSWGMVPGYSISSSVTLLNRFVSSSPGVQQCISINSNSSKGSAAGNVAERQQHQDKQQSITSNNKSRRESATTTGAAKL